MLGQHCREIMESRHPDVLEMDAASNTGVDNIREIIESARYKPIVARTKVFIIDEVHMLSKGAFNALLKTLEEPPPHVKFIFATTEIRKVPVTVLSRCQRFDLRRVDVPLLGAHFKKIVVSEGAKAEDEALALIARAAEGSVRDGLSVLDQAIATSGTAKGVVTAADVRAMLGLADRGRLFDLLEHLFAGRAGAALDALAALHHDGADPIQALADLAEAVHLTTRIKIAGEAAAGIELSAEERRRGTALAARLSIAGALARLADAAQGPRRGRPRAEHVGGRRDGAGSHRPRSRPAKSPRRSSRASAVARSRAAAPVPAPSRSLPPARIAAPSTRPARRRRVPRWRPKRRLCPAPAITARSIRRPRPPRGSRASTRRAPRRRRRAAGRPPSPIPARSRRSWISSGQRRDVRLKLHLEDNVSLVKFDAAGTIELSLLAGAPPEIANELREKLNKWTGRRWMVAVGRGKGERTIGEVRREREAAELEALKAHPAVAAVLNEFPDAKIASVKPVKARLDDDAATG